MQQDEAMPKAKAAAQKALSINGQLAEAYNSLGIIALQYEWNWSESEKDSKRAIELDPNNSVAHEFYGDGYLSLFGKTDQAIAEIRKARELDPLSPIIATDLAKRLSLERKYPEALAEFRKVLEVDPDFAEAQYYLSQTYEQMGLYPEAIAEVKTIKSWDDFPSAVGELGYIYALQGKRQEALERAGKLQELFMHSYTDPILLARIYTALGDKDTAFVWLQKAYEGRSPEMLSIGVDPAFDPLHDDPRFKDLVQRVGLPIVSGLFPSIQTGAG
ncbi:MAG: tetratricopeptide repeat protein [Candidatus Acidiferrales bacterium]